MLLLRCEETLQLLAGQAEPDLPRIREVLQTIIGGQELDLQRFRRGPISEVGRLGKRCRIG